MTDFYDALEHRDPAAREAALLAALPGHIARAQQATSAFAESLAGVDAAAITSRAALAQLPVLRKSELLERQKALRAQDPFGGYAAIGWRGLRAGSGAKRVFQSPGPIYEPEGDGPDYWRMARAIFAAGFRAGDLAHCSFSYHLTPAGSMMESGAHAVGCTTFAGGVGNTELQLQAVAELRPHGYIGTPSFLKILVEKAAETGAPIGSITKAMVGGEAFPAQPARLAGCARHQCLPELRHRRRRPDRLRNARPGRPGARRTHPARDRAPGHRRRAARRRGRRGRRHRAEPGLPAGALRHRRPVGRAARACPTGRSNTRIKGWLGRADQTTKVRGMFVHPSQVAEVARRHPEVGRARLVVEGEMANDRMT
jgi:phenylacetate-CoA ligase